MISNETIQAMVNRIVERFRPERVVLFGSYARGEATEDSDLDLLVELETDPRPNRRGNPIHLMLAEEFRVPTDVIIRTVEQVRKYKDVRYGVTNEAFATGKVLYERHGK